MAEASTKLKEGEFSYIETNNENNNVILLLHGLLGNLSNFQGIIQEFGDKYNVSFPELPIFEMPLKKLSVMGLVDYVERFVDYMEYDNVHLVGNSLGGHIAQLYALRRPDKVKSLTLTGSSGLFENAMGNTFPKRGDYEYIKAKVEEVFYDTKIASKEYVDELFETVKDRNKAIRIVVTAKSAIRHNLANKLDKLMCPTLLVWGKQDKVTPLFVGEKFEELIPNAKLVIVDKCGHAPMMEQPDKFNEIFEDFISQVDKKEEHIG